MWENISGVTQSLQIVSVGHLSSIMMNNKQQQIQRRQTAKKVRMDQLVLNIPIQTRTGPGRRIKPEQIRSLKVLTGLFPTGSDQLGEIFRP